MVGDAGSGSSRAGGLGALVVAALVLSGACGELRLQDGVYACEPTQAPACPADWACLWSAEAGEHRCFRGAASDGGADAAGDGGELDGGVDAGNPNAVTLQGVVWSPGADRPATLEVNRFPIPGAAVIALSAPPADLPQQRYCNECVEVPAYTPHTRADPVTGAFALDLSPGHSYHLVVQKGEFRRVRAIQAPDLPGQVWTLETGPQGERPVETTLPNRTDLVAGDNVPKIGIIDAQYEDMELMFDALGFDYAGADLQVITADVLQARSLLDAFNVIVVPCGQNWPADATGMSVAADNLKQWVADGGRLYVDDFNYDFIEQVWPEFLSYYVHSGSGGTGTGPCGQGSAAPSTVGECSNWSSYDFTGTAGDPDLGAWLELPEVSHGQSLYLQAAWAYLYELSEGIVGLDEDCAGNCGPNGEIYALPDVWMYNSDPVPWGNSPVPTTVSFPYYCGKVLYTVYHTHSGFDMPYELLLQEKIMMYLLMEIQTCSAAPIFTAR